MSASKQVWEGVSMATEESEAMLENAVYEREHGSIGSSKCE